MKKRKVKKFQDGGVLRDRYGNPVRSGSGEIVRTRFPERTYDEQATADMTESSDYSGRRMKSAESMAEDTSNMDVPHSTISDGKTRGVFDTATMNYEPKAGEKVVEEKKTVIRKPAPKTPKRASQSFGVDESGMEERKKAASEFRSTPKSKLSDTGKSVRLNALLKSIPGNPFGLKKGGTVSSASKRADGIAQRGKTKGRIC
jgi:hypothetical protein